MRNIRNCNSFQGLSRKSCSVVEYDIIRWSGTILVVVGHSAYTTMLTETGGIQIDVIYGKLQTAILLLVRLIYSFHMPMFVALSGALYYHTKAYITSNKDFIQRKMQRLLVPFAVVSFLWAIPLKALSGYWRESDHPIRNIIVGQFIRFDNNHLWYIVTLFWIFCLFHSFYKIKEKKWRIAVIVIICLCLFVASQMMTYNYIGIRNAMSHSIWFGGGVFYEKYRKNINKTMAMKRCQIAFMVIGIGAYLAYLSLFSANIYFYALIAVFGMGGVWIVSFYLQKSRLLDTVIYKTILKYSFEIYLLSDPLNYCFIDMIKRLGLSHLYSSNLFCVIFFVTRALGSIIISICVACLILKIKQRVLNHGKISYKEE